jgi:hypothetical protein
MFMGRMTEGTGHCDESVGFTFANVKSLGLQFSECTFHVERIDKESMSLWTANCLYRTEAAELLVTNALGVSDKQALGSDGKTPYRQGFFMKQLTLRDANETIMDCTYMGNVVERIYLQPH